VKECEGLFGRRGQAGNDRYHAQLTALVADYMGSNLVNGIACCQVHMIGSTNVKAEKCMDPAIYSRFKGRIITAVSPNRELRSLVFSNQLLNANIDRPCERVLARLVCMLFILP
jgi:hypothetical protein